MGQCRWWKEGARYLGKDGWGYYDERWVLTYLLHSRMIWHEHNLHWVNLILVPVFSSIGAQSGGVVTFQPTGSSSSALPKLKGIRSRVVNAKRTDLSKGLRRKIEKDNFGFFSKSLSGSNSKVYNGTVEEGRLVRTFFGHTRFATSSKASCESIRKSFFCAFDQVVKYSHSTCVSFRSLCTSRWYTSSPMVTTKKFHYVPLSIFERTSSPTSCTRINWSWALYHS
jgi:hypothetical protein